MGDKNWKPERQASAWRDFWLRYRRSKAGLLGLAIILVLVAVAALAPIIAPHPYTKQNLSNSLRPPDSVAILGTDQLGRDVLSRLIYGSRASIQVGVVATGIAALIGILVGALGGFFGGWVDFVAETAITITWAFPTILMAIYLVSVMGGGLVNVMIAVGVVSWGGYARVVRAQILSLKETDFVQAARVVGATQGRIIVRHLLPNTLSSVMVIASLNMGGAILSEAALSFLGLGIQPPVPSWGSMLNDARTYLIKAPYLSVPPGIAIMIAVLGFNLLGDGLRDAMDPHSRR